VNRRSALLLVGCLTLAACTMPSGVAPVAAPALFAQSQAKALPPGYYHDAEGLKDAALLQALKTLISGQTALTYNEARDVMFADIDDPANTNTILSVYTGHRATGVTDHRSADKRGFATEHTWPQSLGAGWAAAKSDLHHLFPVDTGANSVRSNNPFGTVVISQKVLPDLSAPGQASKLGVDGGGVQVFEPSDRHKGDVARALMYFYVRYALPKPGEKGPGPLSLRNYMQEVAILLAWHHRDPVDAGETRRNDRIFGVQGNRNPFVDRPEFADRAGTAFTAATDL
jgi:endonuclease I